MCEWASSLPYIQRVVSESSHKVVFHVKRSAASVPIVPVVCYWHRIKLILEFIFSSCKVLIDHVLMFQMKSFSGGGGQKMFGSMLIKCLLHMSI